MKEDCFLLHSYQTACWVLHLKGVFHFESETGLSFEKVFESEWSLHLKGVFGCERAHINNKTLNPQIRPEKKRSARYAINFFPLLSPNKYKQ